MAVILGIDPGSRVTGFGVIHVKNNTNVISYLASGCIRTQDAETMSARLGLIFSGIQEVIQIYRPDEVAIEQVFLKENVMSALKLGHARGAAMVACSLGALQVAEYAPRVIKQAVVGFGGAEKTQVQKMVVDLLNLNKAPAADAADALAVAICHANHHALAFRGLRRT
jgi:crossover junction endodeoxyribonuclease RuvC